MKEVSFIYFQERGNIRNAENKYKTNDLKIEPLHLVYESAPRIRLCVKID